MSDILEAMIAFSGFLLLFSMLVTSSPDGLERGPLLTYRKRRQLEAELIRSEFA